jgi:hypothetical protein
MSPGHMSMLVGIYLQRLLSNDISKKQVSDWIFSLISGN